MTYFFSCLKPVCYSMSRSNCCFLICIQVSQEAGQVVWYSHLSQNFPQFIVIHTVKGFGIVNKAEIDVWNSLAFSIIQWLLAIWTLVPLPFLKPAWTSGSSQFMYCWSLAWRILSIAFELSKWWYKASQSLWPWKVRAGSMSEHYCTQLARGEGKIKELYWSSEELWG